MLRGMALGMARQSWARKLALATPGVRAIAWRFVAGEDLSAGLAAVRTLNGRGIKGTLNYVGWHVRDRSEARLATDQVIESLRRIHDEGVDSHVSIKLTQIGLDIDDELCRAELTRILDCAADVGSFVRIDMEELAYVERTLDIAEKMIGIYGADRVGVVIQSYLRTRPHDLSRMIELGARIRLVKGAYRERADAVHREQADIDAAFLADIDTLLRGGRYPAIATHDISAIRRVRAIENELQLDRQSFEFQMLYGVGANLQAALVQEGYTVRCYVPYGVDWQSYVIGCVRRLRGRVKAAGTIRSRRGRRDG